MGNESTTRYTKIFSRAQLLLARAAVGSFILLVALFVSTSCPRSLLPYVLTLTVLSTAIVVKSLMRLRAVLVNDWQQFLLAIVVRLGAIVLVMSSAAFVTVPASRAVLSGASLLCAAAYLVTATMLSAALSPKYMVKQAGTVSPDVAVTT